MDNSASGKVMQKSGMQFEGILRQYLKRSDDALSNVAVYAILRDEWNDRKI